MVLEGVVVEIVRNLDVRPHDIERVCEDGKGAAGICSYSCLNCIACKGDSKGTSNSINFEGTVRSA